MKLTKLQARRLLLSHHNLLNPRQLQGKQAILNFISKVGCIQYDPLDMAGTNPNLVLQARIREYRPELLNELLYSERKLLDGWDKNMAIWQTTDWPYFARFRARAQERYQGREGVAALLPLIRQALAEKGPLSSIDLNFDTKIDWAWAPARAARAALESMYFWGELIVHHRKGTRKYYDLAASSLSESLLLAADPNPSFEEYVDWHIKRRIGGVGLLWNRSGDAWLGIIGLTSQARTDALMRLMNRGEIIPVSVEDVRYPLFIRAEEQALLAETITDSCPEAKASFLAPLDNLLWDRKLIRELFAFDYVWEVYKPAAIRQHGYYVLPVLYGGRFVARFEPRLDKGTGTLRILNWWWEPGIRLTKGLKKELALAMTDFCSYLGASSVRGEGSSDLQFLKS